MVGSIFGLSEYPVTVFLTSFLNFASAMTKKISKVVVLGTGGTIAGWAPNPDQTRQYRAGEVAVDDLVRGIKPSGLQIETEDVARIDSKNMGWTEWQRLVARLAHWLAQEDVRGVVVTHGTDTLEETAILLHALFPTGKTIVITGAMRAANVSEPDGPGNLKDALAVASAPGRAGVIGVFAGQVHAAASLTKLDSQALSAFASADPVPIAVAIQNLDALQARFARQPTHPVDLDVAEFGRVSYWPRVEMVHNHAAQDGGLVRTIMRADGKPAGWVVAGTGNGTMSQGLEDALSEAQQQGAWVWRTTRCTWGQVQAQSGDRFGLVSPLNPYKARVVMVLALLANAVKRRGPEKPGP